MKRERGKKETMWTKEMGDERNRMKDKARERERD